MGNKAKLLLITGIFSLLFCTMLGACGNQHQIYNNHDEIAVLNVGDTYEFPIDSVPEGYSRSDYVWNSNDGCITIDENGMAAAVKGGYANVTAKLRTEEAEYTETYKLRVTAVVSEFYMSCTEVTVEQGESAVLEVITDAEFSWDERIQWVSSDSSVVSAEPIRNFQEEGDVSAYLVTGDTGTAVITASLGRNTAECTVTVVEPNVEPVETLPPPEEALSFLSAYAEAGFAEEGDTALVCTDDVECSVLPEMTPGGGGKYIVVCDLGLCPGVNISPLSDVDISGLTTDGVGFTSLLPPEMRAQSMDEVSFIIRITEGEPVLAAHYESGIDGYVRVFEIRVEDALTGDVTEVLYSLEGKDLPDSISVDAENPPDAYYGFFPDEEKMINFTYRTFADFWLESYRNVVFYGDGVAERYYGSGEVRISANLGITGMQMNEFTNPIDRFVVPDGVEVFYSAMWADSTFVVVPGSPAEAYCKEYEVPYEYSP